MKGWADMCFVTSCLKTALTTFCAAWLICAHAFATAAPAASQTSLHIEDMTWTELRDQLKAGSTTVLIPIGGTEQNGPHIVLGKHNVRVRVLAARIAKQLGHAVVAPVLAYVPEGSIEPPAAHMRFTGTVSIGESAFESVLESAARSFRQHGFRDVVFLGDHGGYLQSEERVAAKLNREFSRELSRTGASKPVFRVHALLDYYRAAQSGHAELLKARGFSADEIGTHAGLADTSLTLALDPTLVRQELAKNAPPQAAQGVYGDPRRASAELGQLGVERIVEISVKRLRELIKSP
jgi:creatinine amidohydrolase